MCKLKEENRSVILISIFSISFLVKVIYNPAPADKNLNSELYQLADFFCPNETEVSILAVIYKLLSVMYSYSESGVTYPSITIGSSILG